QKVKQQDGTFTVEVSSANTSKGTADYQKVLDVDGRKTSYALDGYLKGANDNSVNFYYDRKAADVYVDVISVLPDFDTGFNLKGYYISQKQLAEIVSAASEYEEEKRAAAESGEDGSGIGSLIEGITSFFSDNAGNTISQAQDGGQDADPKADGADQKADEPVDDGAADGAGSDAASVDEAGAGGSSKETDKKETDKKETASTGSVVDSFLNNDKALDFLCSIISEDSVDSVTRLVKILDYKDLKFLPCFKVPAYVEARDQLVFKAVGHSLYVTVAKKPSGETVQVSLYAVDGIMTDRVDLVFTPDDTVVIESPNIMSDNVVSMLKGAYGTYLRANDIGQSVIDYLKRLFGD
ncbi:MAG: hypothetical protein ACSW8A_05775, partial [Lachnospiraceae bacterium]